MTPWLSPGSIWTRARILCRIFDAYKEALGIVGKRFEEGTYFVPELIMAGEMMKTASDLIKPLVTAQQGAESAKLGKFLLGTVEGDIHDIGKDIVHMLHGYQWI